MSEKTEKMPDATEEPVDVNEQNANQQGDSQEPKNVQELTNYIQSMLQQMQDRFQTMSDQVSILDFLMVKKCIFMWSKSSTVPIRKAPKQNSPGLNPKWLTFHQFQFFPSN